MTITPSTIFILSDPKTYAAEFRERLLGLGVSPEYADASHARHLTNLHQIKTTDDGNAIRSGRLQV